MVTTAEDSFNIFRPNLEPVDSSNDEERDDANNVAMAGTEETKQDSSAAMEESKR